MKKLGFYFVIILLCVVTFTGCDIPWMGGEDADPAVNMDAGKITASANNEVQMLEDVRGAVVGIEVTLKNGRAIGSGVAVKDGGYILTNNHVIEDERGIKLYYADKTTGSATVLWKDAALDLAIIKSSRNIPYLGVSASENLRVGEDVYAIGTPLTLEFKHTVTKGIVSAKGRVLATGTTTEGATYMQSLVQHDASINPGNSGGPLINVRGEVVGINTLKAIEAEGIGFAVPIEVADSIVTTIAANNSYTAPYLGIFGFDSDIAAAQGENSYESGVYVISANGPAKEAGIQSGDIIKKVGGYAIEKMIDLRAAIYHFNPGDEIEVEYMRDEAMETVMVKSK